MQKWKEPKKTKSVRFPQGAVYLEKRGEERGTFWFRPESENSETLSDEEILLLADTGMKYLISDERGKEGDLIGWAAQYNEKRQGKTSC